MAKVAYLRTIEDEIITPYYITIDDYCYTEDSAEEILVYASNNLWSHS